MPAGASASYTCVVTAPPTGYTNTATTTGTPIAGGHPVPGGPIDASAQATVQIQTPGPPPTTPPPGPAGGELPDTGTPVLQLIADGLLLLAAGLLLLLAGHRWIGAHRQR